MTGLPFGADSALPLGDDPLPIDGAFTVADGATPDTAVVTAVAWPWLFAFAASGTARCAMLVLAGGGYTQLMVGREGVQVARWLVGLGIDAFVAVHRFPTAQTSPQAPVDDVVAAMRLIRARGYGQVGVIGLSSGGHLAACLLTDRVAANAKPDVAIIGYAPISTNAAGRTVVPDKPPLDPPAKQALYDLYQPDVQLAPDPPPTFIAYSASDPVVPVANAYRLNDALVARGGRSEVHAFADAPHGFALDTREGPVTLWPALAAAWLRQGRFID